MIRLLSFALFAFLSASSLTFAADPGATGGSTAVSAEPIPYFQRYKPTFFLLGKPNTKVQISFKVPVLKEAPLYIGYSQIIFWDLFKESGPMRDVNYNPELFYRFDFPERNAFFDTGFEHESNGRGGIESRSWNRAYLRYQQTRSWNDRQVWWSVKAWVPMSMTEPESKRLPRRRGLWEIQIGASDLFGKFFSVNELILRLYGGGSSRSNPLQGGIELTYREKSSSRIFLLPIYLQAFHGYGENLLDADEKRWGLRAGVGF